NGRAVVANIAGTATDTNGTTHSFEGGHYISVVGYRDNADTVKIADSANPNQASYWITTDALADWIATRGYSA
ncbi:C39 family peptidase, partial [Micromonospora sp. NBRC 101691]